MRIEERGDLAEGRGELGRGEDGGEWRREQAI